MTIAGIVVPGSDSELSERALPVATALAHHAPCPVLVAGPHSADDTTEAIAKEVDHGHHR